MGVRSIALFLLSLGVFGGGLSYYLQQKNAGSDGRSVVDGLFLPGIKKAQEQADGESATRPDAPVGAGAAAIPPAVARNGAAQVEALTGIGSGIQSKREASLRASGVGDLMPTAEGVASAGSVPAAASAAGEDPVSRVRALEQENRRLQDERRAVRGTTAAASAKSAASGTPATNEGGDLRAARARVEELEREKHRLVTEAAALRAEFAAAFGKSLETLGKKEKEEALRARALAYQRLNERREAEFAELIKEYRVQAEQLRAEVEFLEKKLAQVTAKSRR